MKKLIVVLLILLSGCKSSTNILRPEGLLKDAKGDGMRVPSREITASSVAELMNYLASDELGGRDSGEEGINKAATYITGIFTNIGLKPYFASYLDTLSNFKKPAFNVVGYLEGSDEKLRDEFIIIGAHYDHIGSIKPVNGDYIANGANDNATGTSAVIELAEYFAKNKSLKRSVLFVLFSAEEKGLLGSKHLAKKLKNGGFNLYTMINFEMIGVPMATTHMAYLTGYEESNMAQKLNQYAGKELIGFLPQAKDYQLFKRSDNYPFFEEFNLPAQTISTFDFNNYAFYHHVSDEADKMDFGHMANLINEMVPVITAMANSPSKEIKMNE